MGCGSSSAAQAGIAENTADDALGSTRDLRYNMVKSVRAVLGDTYEVHEKELGQAAMGCTVRKVVKKSTGDAFACKTFNIASVKGSKEQARLRAMLKKEIDLIRSLDHPSIVRACEVFEDQGNLHLIMELCQGGDLGKYTYTEVEAAVIVHKILRAILYCHANGIIHRDLKFENILWESAESKTEIKLIDFGLSERFTQGAKLRERVGTVYTMAPEVLQGEYSERADIWSIGCITFQLIAGTPAFEMENEEDTMKRLMAVSYFWPKGSKVSSEAKEFVYNMLKFDPRKRWTAQEALQSRWMKLHEDAIKESAPNSRRKSIAMRTTASLQNFSKYSQFRKIALMVTAAHTGGDSLQATRDMFMKMDTDMNGVISKDELKAAMQEQGLASEELSQLFEGLDMDQSGQIHYMEFLAATLESAGDINEERLKEAFMHMDNDDSGLISFENLKALLGSDATIFTDEDIKAMLLEVSTNGDGKIDFESFCKHVLAPRSQEKVNETLAALSVTQ